jgi:DMSO/TMAO reductase YedYZ heme-binding membrane subunit
MNVAWNVARFAGLVAWIELTISVISGVLVAWARPFRRDQLETLRALHPYLGGLATIFVGVHVGAIVADNYMHFGLADVLVPFASHWRPAAVAWGIVGVYLMAAVMLTSLVRKWRPRSVWRAVHQSSYPLFLVSTLHLVTAGTDARSTLVTGALIAGATVTLAITAGRLVPGRRTQRRRSLPSVPAAPPAPAAGRLPSLSLPPRSSGATPRSRQHDPGRSNRVDTAIPARRY